MIPVSSAILPLLRFGRCGRRRLRDQLLAGGYRLGCEPDLLAREPAGRNRNGRRDNNPEQRKP
jgi:hypothetical protein